MNNLYQAIQELKSEVAELRKRLDNKADYFNIKPLESGVDQLKGKVDEARADVAKIKGDVIKISTDVTGVSSRVKKIEDAKIITQPPVA